MVKNRVHKQKPIEYNLINKKTCVAALPGVGPYPGVHGSLHSSHGDTATLKGAVPIPGNAQKTVRPRPPPTEFSAQY